jgi:hypothetical protein
VNAPERAFGRVDLDPRAKAATAQLASGLPNGSPDTNLESETPIPAIPRRRRTAPRHRRMAIAGRRNHSYTLHRHRGAATLAQIGRAAFATANREAAA